jgi:CRISPR/Cas system CMR subunit Cmr6 (Cas7 group RAMP superfamily)
MRHYLKENFPFLTFGIGVQFNLLLYIKPFQLDRKRLPADSKMADYLCGNSLKLFKSALEEMGIGAKINVEYG